MAVKKKTPAPLSSFDDLDSAGIGVGYQPFSADAGAPMEAPAAPASPGMLRRVGDTAVQFGQGAVTGVKMMSDVFGANNAVSSGLGDVNQALDGLLSATAQGDKQKVAQIMQEAEGKGWGDQIVAGLKAAGVDPVGLAANALGTSLPTMATMLIPGAGPAAVAARMGAGVAMGAGQGVGAVKGQIYDETKRKWLEARATPEQAEAKAQEAAAYGGENTDQMAIGGVLGMGSVLGAERALGKVLHGASKAGPGMLGRVATSTLAETGTEMLQGGQEKFATNTALNRQGFDVDPMSGVVANATLEGAAAAPMGAVAGIPKPAVATAPGIDPAKEAADTIRATETVPESGPMTRASNAATEAKARAIEAGAPLVDEQAEPVPEPVDDPVRDQILALPDGARQDALRAYAVVNRTDVAKGVQQYNRKLLDRLLAENQPAPVLGESLTGTDMGTMLGGGGMAGNTDPLAGALGMGREAQANSITNVAQAAENRPPMPASDAARMLDEARNQGVELAVAEHPSGGFVLVPPQWVSPDVAAQGETRLAETIARMQQADGAPVERAPRTRTEPVDLSLSTDPVQNYMDTLRTVNTPAARAYVRDFDAGRITPTNVQQRMVAEQGKTPDQRIAQAAAEAPAKTDPVADRLARAAAQGTAVPAPTDILNPVGLPFKTRMAADRAAKQTPGAVVPVEGGFVVRPQESVNVQDVPQAPQVPQAAPAISQPGQAPQAVGAQPAGPAAGVPAEGAGAVEAAGVVGDTEPSWSNMTPEQRRRSRLEREIATGITNNGGVMAKLRPSAIEKRKQELAELPPVDVAGVGGATPTATPGAQPAAPIRLGRNNTPLSEGGKPFKTRKAAGDAKKLQPMMRVVTVPGGYALAEKTPAQLAAEERASRRLRNPNTSARGEPIPAHAFIAAAGGLNRVAASDMGVDGNPRIGNRTLFAGQGRGLSMDQATQMLIQDGYLSEGATINDALSLIKTSLTRPQYNADGIERIAEAESAAQFEDYLAAQEEVAQDDEFDPFGPAPATLDGFSDDMLESSGYDAAADAIKAEVRALLEMANAQGVDTESIMLEAHEQTRNATEQDYYESAKSALEAAITGSNRDRGTPAGSEGQGPGAAAASAAEQGLNQPLALDQQAQAATESVAPEALELAAQTPAEAAARQEEAEQAEKSQAAAKRAADAAAKAEDERKRIAQASVRAADRFELGQDPMDSLTGQGSVFDAPAATENVANDSAGQDDKAIRYELPPEKYAQQQGDESWMAAQSPSFKPTARQQLLMDAVAKALDDGAFYNRDVDEHVAQALGVTPEQRARNSRGVEGGDFGFDVYNASRAVHAQRSYAKNREFAKALNLKPGDVLGTLVFNDGKVTTGVKVIGLNESGLIFTFTGKRGAATLNGEVGVDRLAAAMDRAKERGKRKDGYAEFVAGRGAVQPSPQPITRADVTAAQQQAAAIITERIDAMTAGEVNTIARRFLPTMGVRPTVSKERNKAAVVDFTKVNPLAAADEFGATLPTDVRRALQADMEGAVADGFVEQGDAPANDRNAFTLQRLNRETGQMERLAAEDAADRDAAPQPPAEKPKKKPSADQTRAKADLMNALADLGDILGKNTRMNILPEQEQKLLPVLTRVLDAAFRLGYAKFKDSAKFALDQIRTHLGDEAADALTLDHLQGAYIAMAGGKEGTDTKRAVIDVETKAEIEAHEAQTADEAQEDAAAAPDAKKLTESLYQAIGAGNMPKDNPALKKLVEAFDGKPADPARMKQAQEELETAIAMAARDIVAKGQNDKATFDELLRLYESQPSLNIRTSTSVANQAYSTPAPLAFLASRLAGITRDTVAHEPTGGTGMLLIGADPKKALVNELNDLRISALKAQGFAPTQKDAATMLLVPEGTRPDAVVTNPPFGSVKDAEGKPVKVKVDGFSIGQIDHLIAARALETMKDDGKATLILGANKVAGGLSTDDRIFFNWLYSHYNVAGHFEVEGDLYARQGAGWPVRVITINGRQKSGKFAPVAGTIQRADNWNQVYEQFTQSLDAAAKPATGEVGGGPAVAIAAPGASGGRRPQGSTGSAGNVSGARPRVVPDRAKPAAEPVGQIPDEQRLNAQSFVPQPQPGQNPAGATRPAKPAGTTAVAAAPAAAGNEFQTTYFPRSARKDEGVLIPSNMAQPTQDALNRLEDAVGDIDEFARKELGYESTEALHNALMGLQVDSVATAIYQIKQGKAVVIADQTGIGKGRQAASIIRWAARSGMTPVFVSVKPSLFTDMFGDLADIGTHDVAPFILNSDAWVSGDVGEKLFANKPSSHRAAVQSIVDNGKLPKGRNALFMTYSQINTANLQRQALMALAGNAVFVLDESHNAAGASGTGEFMIGALAAAKGVTYLSATYAKRPDNMPLYFKTDIGDAAADSDGLADAMAAGGLPLQTVVSNNLVKAGQMFRRERSYDGVSIASTFDTANRQLHERLSDEATEALRAIVSADKLFHSVFVKSMDKALKAEGSQVQDNAGNQVSAGVQHTEFSSVVHNFVRQMLLGLKAQTAADEAIASLKRGEKPIIAVENTMGSFLSEYAAQNNINQGDSLGAFDYRTVLSRALERSRVINVVLPNGDKSKKNIALSELDPITRKAYDQAQAVIDGLAIDIPVSPIDWMRAEIIRAGFTVAEITGRDLSVDYSNPRKPVLSAIDLTEQRDKVASTRRFNGGELDALILNVAGSTGISLHASEKFADQRQRHMIVAQAAGDINIFMQMLGRVHRTGQVRLPKYTILSVDLPTEKRPTAVLSRKMKSLNANTSSNTESATSVKTADILNKYGDQIVNQYLVDNLELAHQLDVDDLLSSDGERVTDDIARKATGRLALQPIKVQRAFYEDVEAQYDALIEYLNKTNQNDLDPRTFDFDAKELRTEVMFDGPNKTTPFGEDAVYGEYSIKAQGMAMKPEEIQAAIAESLQGKTPAAHVSEMLANLDSQHKQFIEKLAEASREKAAVANADGEYDNTKHEAIGDTLFINKSIESAGLARQMGANFLRSHAIGKTFRVEINSEPYNAVITNVRSTHKTTGNPFSLSKIQITIAVNGALRSITVPATQFRRIEVSSIAPAFRIETLFKEQPANQRETAKIVTGNLLAAYGEIKGVRGTIISFTKADGVIDQGILLPKLFDFSKNTQGDYRLRSGADALKFLQQSTNKDIDRFGIATRDGQVRVLPRGDGVQVRVPKSKAQGARYFLDKNLIAVAGDFVSSANAMVANVDDAASAAKVLDLLMDKQALYALPSMADEAKSMAAPTAMFSRATAGLSPEEAVAMFNQATPPNPYPHKLQAIQAAAKHGANAVQADNGGWLLAPKAQAYTAQELQDAKQRIDKLNRALKKHNNVTPAAVLSDAPTPAMAWGRSIARTLGYNVTFIQPNPDFHGVAVGGDAFVSASADHPEIGLIGHEVLHSFKQSSPDIYQALAERIRPYLKDGVVDAKRRWEDANGGRGTSMAHAEEEVLADLNGAMWLDPKFWREMASNDPSLFRQVAYKFMEVATKAMKGLSRFKADALVTDVDAVRKIIAQEWATQAQEMGNPSEFSETDGPAFSRTPGDQTQTDAFKRWFKDSKVVDAQTGKPLMMYHGTHSSFTEFKPNDALGGGMFFSPSPEEAGAFTGATGSNIMPVYLSAQKVWPKIVRSYDEVKAIRAAKSKGYDAIRVRDDQNGVVNWVVFDPTQVKSATGNNGDFDPANADIRFSRTTAQSIASSMGDMTPDQEQAYKNVAGVKAVPTVRERMDAIKSNLGLKLRQGLVDQFAAIKQLDQNAYVQARMSKGTDGTLEAMLMYGKPFMRDGAPDVDVKDGGFAKVLASLKGEQDRWMMWIAAQRAEKLKAEGKENLMTDDDISALKTLNAGKMADGTARMPIYAKALQELNDYNDAMLKLAMESGLIDQAAYDLMAGQPYVPFYRLMEDGDMKGPKFSSGLTNQKAWQKLKGGSQQLNADLLQNMLLNWSHLLQASAKNRAATATMDAAEKMAVAYKVAADAKGAVKVMRDGSAEHWMVEDPYLLDAISAIHYVPSPLMKPLAKFKQLLTWGVTVNPTFKIRNLIRDSVSAIAQSELGYNPAANVAKGWKLTAKDSQIYASMLASGGLIKFGTQENTDQLRAQVAKLGGVVLDKSGAERFFGQIKDLYDVYNEFGDRAENVNRAALYDALIKKGKTHAEAAFMARDLMDFSMGGSAPVVRFLTQTVPFLNARLVGLDKLGRAAIEDPRRFAAVTGAVALASLALLAAYSDDDDWKKREDWDRDAYWWFKIGGQAYRIPKPFEVGAIGTLAERTAELMFNDEMTGKRYMERVSHMLSGTFSFNPVPQAFKPLLDLYANKDSFTGRAIESQSDQRLRPQDRYSERTPEVAKFLGGLGLPDPAQLVKGEYSALSPKQVDHLVRGYFSWVGTAAMTVSDFGLRPLAGRGERPDMRLKDVFIAGNFVENLPTGSSRYVTQMYEQSRQVEQAYASYQEAIKAGDTEKAQSIKESAGSLLRNRPAYTAATRQLAEINRTAKRIEADQAMAGAAKRARLTELEQRRQVIAQRVSRLANGLSL